MNKNSENYKSTYSQLRPSAEAVERVMDMTSEKKIRFKPVVKRLAAAALAFAVLIGGSLGINHALQNDSPADELRVLVAYAATGEFLNIGSVNQQELFYSIHFAPCDDKEAITEARKKYGADVNKVMEQMEKNDGYGTMHHRNEILYNDAGERTAEYFKVSAGQFALSLNDYSNIETFKVENSNTYGELYFEYDFFGDLAITGTEEDKIEYYHKTAMLLLEEDPPFCGREFEISGDVLRQSQTNGFYSFSLGKSGKEINLGYILYWEISDELLLAIGNDPNFDLSQIKDTITFTVEFNDGSVKNASIDLYFDSDGYMHFGK